MSDPVEIARRLRERAEAKRNAIHAAEEAGLAPVGTADEVGELDESAADLIEQQEAELARLRVAFGAAIGTAVNLASKVGR